jgi:ankyrin repeat protein
VASHCGKAEAVETLLRHKANVNAREEYQKTPLHFAAKNGHTDTASILLSHGKDNFF